MDERIDRRGFFGLAAGLAAGFASAFVVNTESTSRIKAILWALLGRDRVDPLRGEPRLQDIIDTFHALSTGRLMYRYQAFWPIYFTSKPIQLVREVETLCDQRLAQERVTPRTWKRWHRFEALKAVVAIHSLRSALPDEHEELSGIIVGVLRRALRSDQRHREVLEIAWQNMLTALLRDPENWDRPTPESWQRFTVTPEILAETEALCLEYLRGERFLRFSAATAWQLLITYEKALLSRGDVDSATHVKALRGKIAAKAKADDAYFQWFRLIEDLYASRVTYLDMLPQMSELVMGRQHLSGEERNTASLFTLMRFQQHHANRLLLEGKISSPFVPDRKRAEDTDKSSLHFLANYGVTQKDWPELQALARRIALPPDAVAHMRSVFKDYGKYFELSEHEAEEREEAADLAKRVPFRLTGAEGVLAQLDLTRSEQGRPPFSAEALQIEESAYLLPLLAEPAEATIDRVASSPVTKSQYRGVLEVELKKTGEALTGLNLPMERRPRGVLVSLPAGSNPAGAGRIDPPGEGVSMEARPPAETPPTPRPVHRRGRYKIVFDDQHAANGLRVLACRSTDEFYHVGRDTYLVNERQLADLDEEGVPYTVLRRPT